MDRDWMTELQNLGVPVDVDDTVFAPLDHPEYGDDFCWIIAGERPGGFVFNVRLRSILSATQQSKACEHALQRIATFGQHGPEFDGWGMIEPGLWQYWLRLPPPLDPWLQASAE